MSDVPASLRDPAPAPDARPNPASEAPAPPARPWFVSALLALAAVALLLLGAWGAARLKSPYPFYGTAYPAGKVAANFSGTDDRNRPYAFTPGQTGGRTTALFFGFTHCPNICPLSLAYLDKVKKSLPPAQRERFDVVMVSVDPDRDTPARLREYVTYFGQATGVRIPEPKLSATAREYGVGYQKVDVKGSEYQVNHTTATYLIDSAGQLRALWDYTQLPQVERVVKDVEYVMENPGK
ncbi:SCO family protein [Deinococcus taklimakanensis]|uniref:SCO family protein n=1 Tax=Deinococcus taklimakanensis TaxID=536443 RepID=A0ABW5P1G1_9DEIO